MKKRISFILLLILILAFILRFYKLNIVPPGIYIDEISIGYNAFSILKTGRDEHGVLFPFWFKAFGEYKLPFYIYLTSISELVLGKNVYALRLPSIIAGMLGVLGIYFMLKLLLTQSNKSALLGAFLLAISGWHIHFSRGGFEANLMFGLLIWAIYFHWLSFKNNKSVFLFLSLILFILSLYTYNTARILTPLLIIIMSFKKNYRWLLNKANLPYIIIILILLTPFIFFNLSKEGMSRAATVSFTREVKTLPDSNLFNYYAYTKQYLINYLSYFSTNFLFISGDQQGRHSVRELGQLYLWQCPILLLGLLFIFKEKKNKLPIYFLVIAPVAGALSIPSPHALRSIFLILPFIILTVYGLRLLFQYVKNHPKLKIILNYSFLFIIVYFLVDYLHIYYIHYPKNSFIDWGGGYQEMAQYVNSIEKEYPQIIITNNYGMPYIYMLFFSDIDPNEYLKKEKDTNNFNKYIFVNSPYTQTVKEKTLYIAPPWEKVIGKHLKDIKFINEDVAFKLWEL